MEAGFILESGDGKILRRALSWDETRTLTAAHFFTADQALRVIKGSQGWERKPTLKTPVAYDRETGKVTRAGEPEAVRI